MKTIFLDVVLEFTCQKSLAGKQSVLLHGIYDRFSCEHWYVATALGCFDHFTADVSKMSSIKTYD